MDGSNVVYEELKKYFVLVDGEKAKNRSTKWKCNINECGKIINSEDRMIHLKYNHINIFYEIDQKMPLNDPTKKRLSVANLTCPMCTEQFDDKSTFQASKVLFFIYLFYI